MAVDCYQTFKTTYAQAIADGLATAVATAAAQSAMDDCLRSASTQQAPAQAFTPVPGSRLNDVGPAIGGVLGPTDRASALGKTRK